MNLFQACKATGGVKRVVLTSSTASIAGDIAGEGKFSEEDWTDTTKPGIDTYAKSKVVFSRRIT